MRHETVKNPSTCAGSETFSHQCLSEAAFQVILRKIYKQSEKSVIKNSINPDIKGI